MVWLKTSVTPLSNTPPEMLISLKTRSGRPKENRMPASNWFQGVGNTTTPENARASDVLGFHVPVSACA